MRFSLNSSESEASAVIVFKSHRDLFQKGTFIVVNICNLVVGAPECVNNRNWLMFES